MTARSRPWNGQTGLTLVELVVAMAIISVLVVAALPLAKVSVKRSREVELKRSLRGIRRAIDDFHKSYLVSVATPGGAGRLPGRASNIKWSNFPGSGGQPPGQPRGEFPGQLPGQVPGQVPGQAPGAGGQIPGVQDNEVPQIPLMDTSRFDPIDCKGYPPTLETLVEGVPASGNPDDTVKFLRRLPRDPMTEDGEWGLRSYQDRADSETWGRQNVYDVYTKSTGVALDGSKYKDW